MDPSMEESARSLGKGPIRTLVTVTVPMLRPAIAAGSLLVALYVLSDFGAVSLMRYETFTWSIYQQYQGAFDRSIAAVLSLVLVCFAVAVLVLEQWSRGRIRYHRTGAGRGSYRQCRATGRMALAGVLSLRRPGGSGTGVAGLGIDVLAGPRHRGLRDHRQSVGPGPQLSLRLWPGCTVRGDASAARGHPVSPAPRRDLPGRGERQLCRVRSARGRGGPGAGVLRGKLCSGPYT